MRSGGHLEVLKGIDYLMAMPQYGLVGDASLRPGLSRITRLLSGLGNPERGVPVIHVAGTNGKGSTASWIAAILTAHGLRVGLHTSPHLKHAGERMRVDGTTASVEWLGYRIDEYRTLIEETRASYFETTVAMSMLRFAEAGVDVAVVEVGLGGKLDATNVLRPAVSVVTTVGLDHTDILGDTLGAIAGEKAGIIKNGAPVVLGRQAPEAAIVLEAEAARQGGALFSAERDTQWRGRTLQTPSGQYTHLFPKPEGDHQRDNAATAVLAVEAFLAGTGRSVSASAVRNGLRNVKRLAGLRGRFEAISEDPLIVLDVAHNPDALGPLFDRFHLASAGRSPEVLIALMRDKDIRSVVALLARHAFLVHPLNLQSPRALPTAELQVLLENAEVPLRPVVELHQLGELLRDIEGGRALLVTGSHQVVASVLDCVE
ncbi:MAG: dihydrofolate synthase/folylpolyglutamate synthase [Rhodothermales bacterium]|jgi:dihydrofolate synthase/folylpolyglutamate synthase